MENNQDSKVQIKLEKYRWADEIAQERRRKKSRVAVISFVVVAFMIGLGIGSRFTTPQSGGVNSGRFDAVYQDVLKYWFFAKDMEAPETNLIDNAIKGMLDLNGDPHTSYMTADEMKAFRASINLDFDGIGVQYFPGEGANIITRVFKGSPAEAAGLKAGDVIHKVDGTLATDFDVPLDEAIKGESGSKVTLEVLRNLEPVTFEITRGKISALTWGQVLDDNVGYLELSSFGMNLSSTVIPYLDQFKEEGVEKLILDLRDNGGGYLNAVEDIAPLFLPNGAVVFQEEHADGTKVKYEVKNSIADKYAFKELVVLINQNSASAAEVFALALQQNVDVTLVGHNSYGKGTIQTSKDYRDGSALKITTGKWNAPDGTNIHGVGIKPDVAVKLADIFYSEYPNLEQEVRKDQVDPSVSFVQKGLKYLGYDVKRTDSYYDASTEQALKAFKSKLGMDVNDVIDADVVKQVYASVMLNWATHRFERDTQLQKAIEVVNHGR